MIPLIDDVMIIMSGGIMYNVFLPSLFWNVNDPLRIYDFFWKFSLVFAYDCIDSYVLKRSSISPFARYDRRSYDENYRPIFAKIISRLVGIPQMMERNKPLQMNSPKELGCPSPLQRISILLYRLFVHTTSKKIKNKRRSQCLLALRCDEI